MKRVLWWVAVAGYGAWVLSPWGWVDLVSLIGVALGGAVTWTAVGTDSWDHPPTPTERFWGTLVSVLVCGTIGYAFYGPSTPHGRAAILFGAVAGVVLTAGYYSSQDTKVGTGRGSGEPGEERDETD